MNLETNLTYFARGCFLAGTLIETPDGDRAIEELNAGDEVTSFNETTKTQQTSTIGEVDVLQRDEYYVINGIINATAEHPFYTTRGIQEVKSLKVGDKLVGRWDKAIPILKIEKVKAEVTVYNLLEVTPNNNYYANRFLVHNKGGGGRSSGGFRSSSSSKSSTSKPPAGTSTKKAGSTVKTSSGTTVKSSTKTPTNKQFTSQKGIVGDNGYRPYFTNGYTAPAGSVVYYRDNSFIDYLPWIYLFNQDNPARPENQQATVVQPDGKEVQVKPVAQGADGMMILNWILLILIVSAIIGGIIYLVNKLTSKDTKPTRNSYGSYI